jgi:2-polyprenyl-3-methyl-5-hydroxy-6-metoxy-1,4-benzoquinol methylase
MIKTMYLEKVRNQYENYPYPYRDPIEERNRLIKVGIEQLELINFYCFKGACDFNHFRVLVAGGGTGDSIIYLAEQLKEYDAELWYVDISEASLIIAKARAKERKLDNINWLHASILSLDDDIGKFDYISCTGVLHHLDDPLLGLKKLRNLLTTKGAMGLMLYGEYGRTGVYQMQKLMSLINQNEKNTEKQIINTKKILKKLPETNWFNHNNELIVDHVKGKDNGLVDLLLHQQDRAFNVKEIYELLEQSELNMVEYSDVKMRMSYRPELYITDNELLTNIKSRSVIEQQCVAELLVGAFKKHEFYASRTENCKASFDELSNIPFFFPTEIYKNLGTDLAKTMLENSNKSIAMKHYTGFEFDLMATELNYLLFKNINGLNSLKTIYELIRTEMNDSRLDNDTLKRYYSDCFYQFQQLDWLLLKAK